MDGSIVGDPVAASGLFAACDGEQCPTVGSVGFAPPVAEPWVRGFPL